MYICKKKCFTLVYLLLVLFSPSLYFDVLQDTTHFQGFNSNPKLNQALNFTIISYVDRVIWIEGVVDLIVTANESGIINCELIDSNSGKYFTTVSRTFILIGNNQSQNLRITYNPLITTLPGKYNINLTITGLYTYTENFEVILGMGYIILLFILGIFIIGLILILRKKIEVKSKKPTISLLEEPKSSEIIEGTSKKISCPECRKLIDEGLAFCPECGIRIPEFLRYNHN